ncbi:MAG: hypothetical protein QM765_21430 [Myxococcales bacterium]
MTAVCLAITAPWWWWNLTTFGSIQQVSTQALFLYWRGVDWAQPLPFLAISGKWLSSFVVQLFLYGSLCVGLLVGIRRAAPEGFWRPWARSMASRYDYAALVLLGCALYYGFWQGLVRYWYFLGPLVLVVAATAETWAAATAAHPRGRVVSGLARLVIPFAVVNLALATAVGFPDVSTQAGAAELARWLQQQTRPTDRVGIWNSGIVSYFSGRQVVNLDGVVNNPLVSHLKATRTHQTDLKRLQPYLCSLGLTHIADFEDIFPAGELMDRWGYEPVHSARAPRYAVFRLRCEGPTAGPPGVAGPP